MEKCAYKQKVERPKSQYSSHFWLAAKRKLVKNSKKFKKSPQSVCLAEIVC